MLLNCTLHYDCLIRIVQPVQPCVRLENLLVCSFARFIYLQVVFHGTFYKSQSFDINMLEAKRISDSEIISE